jgi:type I restriction enzyme S subunit
MNNEFLIPENWKIVTFEDISEGKNAIVDGPFGSNLKTSDYIDDKVNGIPVLTTKNLEGDYSDEKVRFISKEKYEELKRSQVNPGDILVAKIGSIGKTGIYPKNARTAIIPANLLKFTVSKKVNFNYVFYYLNSRGLQNRIKKISTATAQPAFNLTKFRKLQIPLPPISEQQLIVSKIEELLSDLENGKHQLLLAQQQLRIYRQSLLKWAFEGKLTNKNVKDGELPEGWEWLKIVDVAKINPKLPHKENIPNDMEIQFLPMKLVEEVVNKIHLTETRKFSEVQKRSYTPFIEGDVIFAKVTPCMENGKIAIVENLKNKIGYGSSEFHVIRCSEAIINKYVFYFLVQDKFRKEAENAMTGAVGLRRVPKQFIENHNMPLAPIPEQQLIVDELESKLTVCDKIEETISQSLLQAESLRQSILKKAFEGKLV